MNLPQPLHDRSDSYYLDEVLPVLTRTQRRVLNELLEGCPVEIYNNREIIPRYFLERVADIIKRRSMQKLGTYKECAVCHRLEHHKKYDDKMCERCVSRSKRHVAKAVKEVYEALIQPDERNL